MIDEIQNLIVEYTKWLSSHSEAREVGSYVVITTPFLDRHNDHLQIYARKDNGGYVLSDDAYIIQDLQMSGCNLDSKKRRELLRTVLNGFGVQVEDNALVVKAGKHNFGQKKHNLLQAMLAVNDMFFTAAPTVTSLFLEDVTNWLEASEVRYVPSVKITGLSGYDHVFDFAIPKSRKAPERIVQAINRPTRETAEVCAFAWIDTKDARPSDAEAFVLLNDADKAVPTNILSALESYDIEAVPWSQRDRIKEELVA